MYLWEVKPSAEATHKWDIFKPVGTFPTPSAYPPPACSAVRCVPS